MKKTDCLSGTIHLNGHFTIAKLQNHYPDGSKQFFNAEIQCVGTPGEDSTINTVRIQFSDAPGSNLAPPKIDGENRLVIPMPATSLGFWEMVLTRFPSDSFVVAYTVSAGQSWAFVNANGEPPTLPIGAPRQ